MIFNALLYACALTIISSTAGVLLCAQGEGETGKSMITLFLSSDGIRGRQTSETIVAPHMLDSVLVVMALNGLDEPVYLAGDQFNTVFDCRTIITHTGAIHGHDKHTERGGLFFRDDRLMKGVPKYFISPMRSVLRTDALQDSRDEPIVLRLELCLMGLGGVPVASTTRDYLVFTETTQWERYCTGAIKEYRLDPHRAVTVVNILAAYEDGVKLLIRQLAVIRPDQGSYPQELKDYLEVALRAKRKSFVDGLLPFLVVQNLPKNELEQYKSLILGAAIFDEQLFDSLRADDAFRNIRPSVIGD